MTFYTRGDYDVYANKRGTGYLVTSGGNPVDDELFDTPGEAIEYLDDMLNCPKCGGTGMLDDVECEHCAGWGDA